MCKNLVDKFNSIWGDSQLDEDRKKQNFLSLLNNVATAHHAEKRQHMVQLNLEINCRRQFERQLDSRLVELENLRHEVADLSARLETTLASNAECTKELDQLRLEKTALKDSVNRLSLNHLSDSLENSTNSNRVSLTLPTFY